MEKGSCLDLITEIEEQETGSVSAVSIDDNKTSTVSVQFQFSLSFLKTKQ